MAFEKILNTRIALKIDTLENWLKSTLPLKKGEIALATTAASAGTGLTEPVIMIKVGEDGVKTFKDLEWNVYAKAADVLGACKTEEGLRAFVNGVIADAGIASDEAMQELAGRVTTAEGKITTLEGNITTLNGEGEGSVAKKITDAIAALNLANTYEAKGEAAKVQGELNSYKESNDIALANVKATAEAAYVKPVTGIAKTDLSAEVQASLGKADTALQSHQDISHLAVKTEVETELGKKVDKTTYEGKIGELETAIGGKVDKVEGKSLISDSEITRLANVTNYDDTQVKADIAKKADAATMTTELGKKVDKVEGYSLVADTEIARLAGVNNYDDTALAGRVKAIEDDYLKAEDKYDDTELVGRVGALETASATHALKTEVEALEQYVGTFTASEGVDTVVKYIDAKTANIASDERVGGIEDRLEVVEGDYLKGADKTEVVGLINAEKERAEGIEGGLETRLAVVEGDYLKASDKTELQNQINTILNNPDTEGVINSINEFTQYIEDHGEIAEGFRTDIDANAQAIEDLEAGVGNTYETKSDATAKLDEAKTYADGLNTAMDTRVKALEGINHEAYVGADEEVLGEAKEYADGLNTAMDTRVKVLEAIDHEAYKGADETVLQSAKDYADGLAGNYAEKVHGHEIGEVNGLQNALNLKANDADLKAVAKSGLIDDLSIGEGTVLVFDCGNATV